MEKFHKSNGPMVHKFVGMNARETLWANTAIEILLQTVANDGTLVAADIQAIHNLRDRFLKAQINHANHTLDSEDR